MTPTMQQLDPRSGRLTGPTHANFPWFAWSCAGIAIITLGFLWEGPVDAALNAADAPALKRVAQWCSASGRGELVIAVTLALATLCFLLHRPRAAGRILSVGGSALLIGLGATLLRSCIGRTRPTADVTQGFYGVWHDGHWLIGDHHFAAFPSGHSALAAGLAAALWLVHRPSGALASFYALAVMWSRIALRAHHLSDVLASVVLAVPLAWLIEKHLAPGVHSWLDRLGQRWNQRWLV